MISLRTVLAGSIAAALTGLPCAAAAAVPYMSAAECRGTLQRKPKHDPAQESERVIAEAQLPAAVRAALGHFAKDGMIDVKQVEEHVEKGRTTYEIDLVHNALFYEVEFDASGKELSREIEARVVSLESLPRPARWALEREAGAGKVLEVLEEKEDKASAYEADIQRGSRVYKIRIDAKGNLIERDITLDMLPRSAYRALVCAAQGGSITELDEELRKGQHSYEANIVIEGQEFELSVDIDGKVVELDVD